LEEEVQELRNLTIYLQTRLVVADAGIRWTKNYFDLKNFLWSDKVLITSQVLAVIQAPVIGFLIFLWFDKVR
jgi:hypothetical protein